MFDIQKVAKRNGIKLTPKTMMPDGTCQWELKLPSGKTIVLLSARDVVHYFRTYKG